MRFVLLHPGHERPAARGETVGAHQELPDPNVHADGLCCLFGRYVVGNADLQEEPGLVQDQAGGFDRFPQDLALVLADDESGLDPAFDGFNGYGEVPAPEQREKPVVQGHRVPAEGEQLFPMLPVGLCHPIPGLDGKVCRQLEHCPDLLID